MAHYIIDSNIVIKAIQNWELRNSILYCSHTFSAPKKLVSEVASKKNKIAKRAKISPSEYDKRWDELRKKISLVDVDQSRINQAEMILRSLKHLGITVHDKAFFAISLYLKCSFWTFEKKYWEKSSIRNALHANGITVVSTIDSE